MEGHHPRNNPLPRWVVVFRDGYWVTDFPVRLVGGFGWVRHVAMVCSGVGGIVARVWLGVTWRGTSRWIEREWNVAVAGIGKSRGPDSGGAVAMDWIGGEWHVALGRPGEERRYGGE